MDVIRNPKFGGRGLLLAATAALALAGWMCAGPEVRAEKPAKPTAQPSTQSANPEQVVAVVGESEITREELETAIAPQLLQLEQQRHQLLEKGLQQVIADRLVELEAEKAGVAPEEYLRQQLEARSTEPTDAEVDAFYEARKAQITQPKEQVVGAIRQHLKQQGQQRVYREYIQELEAKHSVETRLEPFRMGVEIADSPAKGPADAPVTIVEFSDFECPYCGRLVPTLEQVSENYGDQVRLVFRQFPLNNIHPRAQKAAEASLCAHEQGKFWEMHDAMFEEQKALAVEQLKGKAEKLALDMEAFTACLESGEYADEVAADLAAGERVGVSGTPAIFINGRPLSGAVPYEQVAQVIDEELRAAGIEPAAKQAEKSESR